MLTQPPTHIVTRSASPTACLVAHVPTESQTPHTRSTAHTNTHPPPLTPLQPPTHPFFTHHQPTRRPPHPHTHPSSPPYTILLPTHLPTNPTAGCPGRHLASIHSHPAVGPFVPLPHGHPKLGDWVSAGLSCQCNSIPVIHMGSHHWHTTPLPWHPTVSLKEEVLMGKQPWGPGSRRGSGRRPVCTVLTATKQ